jgi:hypothetical protein
MKKIFIFIFFICINYTVNAQFQLGFIPLDLGVVISDNNEYSLDINLNILYLSKEFVIESDDIIKTGIGITWVPVNYRYLYNNHYWSFINLQVFWNIFALIPNGDTYNKFIEGVIFGPFIFGNYAPNFDFNNYILTYGIRYNFTGWFENARLYFLNFECGFRNIDQKNKFYFNIGIDIILTTFLVIDNYFP